jgi:hypothetical protein
MFQLVLLLDLGKVTVPDATNFGVYYLGLLQTLRKLVADLVHCRRDFKPQYSFLYAHYLRILIHK